MSLKKKMVKIIGLSGQAGAGKDETGSFICKNYGPWFTNAWAKNLKEGCMVFFGLTRDQVYTQEGKETVDEFWGETPRRILQRVGTDLFRNHYDEDFWVKSMKRTLFGTKEDPIDHNWVVTDCRFPNEADAIREWGGEVWHIVRPGHAELAGDANAQQHASETSMDGYQHFSEVIVNDGTLEELKDKIQTLMEKRGHFLMRKKSKGSP